MARDNAFNHGALIFTAEPEWHKGVDTTFCCQTTISESLTGIEERIANLQRPLIKMSFTARNMDWHNSAFLRTEVEDRGEHGVAVPVWMDACMLFSGIQANATKIACEARNRLFPWFWWAILWRDQFYWDLVKISTIAAGEVTLDNAYSQHLPKKAYNAGAYLIPLAFGHMTIPQSEYHSADVSDVPIEFEERHGRISQYSASAAVGSVTGYYSLYPSQSGEQADQDFEEFLIPPTWNKKPTHGAADDMYFEPIDVGTSVPYQLYTAKRRKFAHSWLLDRYDLQQYLRHWENREGRQKSFWMPTWTHDFTVTQTAESGSETIVLVRSGAKWQGEAYQAAYTPDMTLIRAASITEVECHEVWYPVDPTPEITPGTPLSAGVRVRFSDDELKVHCHTPDTFDLRAEFIECPNELTENPCTDKIAYLYDVGDDALANWGYNIPANGKTYIAQDIVHESIEHSESLMGEEIEIKSSYIHTPTALYKPVKIYRANLYNYPAESIIIDQLFSGIIVSVETESHGVTRFKVSSDLRNMSKSMPGIILQRQCNHILYSDQCDPKDSEKETLESKHTYACTVAFINPIGLNTTRTVAITDTPASLPAAPKLAGSTVTINEENYIVMIDFDNNGTRTLILNKDVIYTESTGISASVKLWCDKTVGTCCTIFNNVANFGGCPYLPANNTVEQVAIDQAVGGKK